ncbi:hypothetical protein IAT38_003604 [Cryptococcus sp. DSM 104549]
MSERTTPQSPATAPPAPSPSFADLMASLPGEVQAPIFTYLSQSAPQVLMPLSRELWHVCHPILYKDIILNKRNRYSFCYGFGGNHMNGHRDGEEWGEIHREGRLALAQVQKDGDMPRSSLGRKLVSLEQVHSVCVMDRKADFALTKTARRAFDKFHQPSLFWVPEGITPTIIFQAELTSVWFANDKWRAHIVRDNGCSFYAQPTSRVFPRQCRQVVHLPDDLSDIKLRKEAYEWLEKSVNTMEMGGVEELCADQVWPCEMSLVGADRVEFACPRGREWGCAAGHERDEECFVECLMRWIMPWNVPWW